MTFVTQRMSSKSHVALITGGASGIGYEMASILFGRKANVIVIVDSARSQQRQSALSNLRSKCQKDQEVIDFPCDVSDPVELHKAFDIASSKGQIKIVCNNAGICNEINWRKQIDVNLGAVIEGTYLGIHHMRKHGNGGVIVNTASMGAVIAQRYCPVYSATKAGVVHFTRSLDHLAKEGIKVNALCPSFTKTPFLTTGGMPDSEATPQIIDISKKVDEVIQALGGTMPVSQVSQGLLFLLDDDNAAGQALMCLSQGNSYLDSPFGDPVGQPPHEYTITAAT